jgi:homoserine kinase
VRLTVRAPATVANLGPGFDCLAVALDLANEFVLDTGSEPGLEVQGEGSDELSRPDANLAVLAIGTAFRQAGRPAPPYRLSCHNAIPLRRGLGSSATAVVAGAMIAGRLMGAEPDRARVLEEAASVEGHADNVAACLLGGLTLAYRSDDRWRAVRADLHPEVRPVVLVPVDEEVATQLARQSLPQSVPFDDAQFNLSRSALTLLALTERPDLLEEALADRLHQDRRLALAPLARALFEDLRRRRVPVCVAGAGPSLLAFEFGDSGVPDPGPGWRVLRPNVSPRGATMEG